MNCSEGLLLCITLDLIKQVMGVILASTELLLTRTEQQRKRPPHCFHCKVIAGGLLGSIFAGYVPLASQNSYPIIVYSVANN